MSLRRNYEAEAEGFKVAMGEWRERATAAENKAAEWEAWALNRDSERKAAEAQVAQLREALGQVIALDDELRHTWPDTRMHAMVRGVRVALALPEGERE